MAVRTRDEISAKIKAILGERADDEALEFLEDISDTFDDYEKRGSAPTNEQIERMKEDYEARIDELDKSWRQRYRDRFLGLPTDKEPEDYVEEEIKEKELTFEGLFERKDG